MSLFDFKLDATCLDRYREALKSQLGCLAEATLRVVQECLGDKAITFNSFVPDSMAVHATAITCLLGLKFVSEFEHSSLLACLQLLRDIAEAPLELVRDACQCTDLAWFEDLSSMVAKIGPHLSGETVVAKTLRAAPPLEGESLEILRKLHTVVAGRLATQESKCLGPKLLLAIPVIYADADSWTRLKNSNMPEGPLPDDIELFDGRECTAVAALHETHKAQLGPCQLAVEEVATYFSALGKSDLATVLQLHWALCRVRLANASVREHMNSLAQDFSAVSAAGAARAGALGFSVLLKAFEHLLTLKQSGGLQAAFESCMAHGEPVEGMILTPFRAFRPFVEFVLADSEKLLAQFVGKVAARLHFLAEKLEAAIPNYKEWVVTNFNMDVARKELVDTSWSWFAVEWVKLSKLHVCALSNLCNNSSLECFNVIHKSTHDLVLRSLDSGKLFVATVATVVLIIDTLPATLKGQRADVIFDHCFKMKAQGARNHDNLHEYLSREYKSRRQTGAACRAGLNRST